MDVHPTSSIIRGLARIQRFEHDVCVTLNRGSRSRLVARFFAAVSRLGDGVVWYSLMALMALTQDDYGLRACAVMAVAGLAGATTYKLLKSNLVRERPFIGHPGIQVGCQPLDRYSFPSGHTLHAVMFTVIAVAWFPVLAAALIPLAVLIALSRVILGLHYPTDVIVGALIGWSLAEIALLAVPPG
ncbi:MAG: phosphatase PAP2 family protein [Pseudomonadota bacterium]